MMNEISRFSKKYPTDYCKYPDHSILHFEYSFHTLWYNMVILISYNINGMHDDGQQGMHPLQNCERLFIKKYAYDVILRIQRRHTKVHNYPQSNSVRHFSTQTNNTKTWL